MSDRVIGAEVGSDGGEDHFASELGMDEESWATGPGGGSTQWSRWLARYDTSLISMSRKQDWDRFVHAGPRERLPLLSRVQRSRLSSAELADYDEARIVWHANLPTVRTQLNRTGFGGGS